MQTNEYKTDDWYEQLMNAHQGLTDAQSRRLDAALVLMLANRVADPPALGGCIDAARAAVLMRENT
jgi:hypothetical protein